MPLGLQSPFNVTGASAKSNGSNYDKVIVITESLTTTAGSVYTHTHYNGVINSDSIVLVSVQNGTNAQGDVSLGRVTNTNGQVVITITNRHASQAFNGTLIISIVVFN